MHFLTASLLTALTLTEVAVGVGLFLLSAVLSLAAVAWVLSRLPADYFRGKHRPLLFGESHPVLGWVVRIGKNLAGLALIALGVVLSLPGVPGQGVLTIFLGLLLIDYPGKRRFERWLVSQPRIRQAIDALRTARGRPPLELDEQKS
jgi:hypothetical protein